MSKIVSNRIYLKKCFFGFKMIEGKPVRENLDDFRNLIQDLEHVKFTILDEDHVMILLKFPSKW